MWKNGVPVRTAGGAVRVLDRTPDARADVAGPAGRLGGPVQRAGHPPPEPVRAAEPDSVRGRAGVQPACKRRTFLWQKCVWPN